MDEKSNTPQFLLFNNTYICLMTSHSLLGVGFLCLKRISSIQTFIYGIHSFGLAWTIKWPYYVYAWITLQATTLPIPSNFRGLVVPCLLGLSTLCIVFSVIYRNLRHCSNLSNTTSYGKVNTYTNVVLLEIWCGLKINVTHINFSMRISVASRNLLWPILNRIVRCVFNLTYLYWNKVGYFLHL